MLYTAENLIIENSRELQIGFGSFEFNKNILTIIKGKSGIGKTTLLKVLGLLSMNISIDSEITLSINNQGKPVDLKTITWDEKEHLREIYFAYIFQEDHLIDSISVRDNILFPALLTDEDISLIEEKLEEMLKHRFLSLLRDKLDESCSILSGGEKKKVALLRAMLKDSEILIADEPWTNLGGGSSRGDVKEYIDFFIEQRKNKSTILATHDDEAIKKFKSYSFVETFELVETERKGTLISINLKAIK